MSELPKGQSAALAGTLPQAPDRPETVGADTLLFLPDDSGDQLPSPLIRLPPNRPAPWKILVVDDDDEIHAVTRFVLNRLEIEGAALEIVDAYNSRQAVDLIQQHGDFAVALVDVVMESERAGLDAVRRIREELNNHLLRIILRTGQPGMAPERQVIAHYDINGYLEKNEVTADKLYSALHTGVRTYRELKRLDDSRRGLQQVIDGTSSAFHETSLAGFTGTALQHLGGLMRTGEDGKRPSGLAVDAGDGMIIVAGNGRFADKVGLPVDTVVDIQSIKQAEYGNDGFSGCDGGPLLTASLRSSTGAHDLLYMERAAPADALERQLLALYTGNLAVAYENFHLRGDAASLLRESVYLLAESVEKRCDYMVFHLRRVAEGVRILCRGVGIGLQETEEISLAAALHDVGTLRVPEAVLNKPQALNDEEWRQIRLHCWAGHDMLKQSRRPVFRLGASVALCHHERWDGSGYPNGLAGNAIPFAARLVAIVDCFDALLCKRPHRDSWTLDRALDHLRQERERAFDPELIDIFFNHVEVFNAIRQRLPD